MGRSLRCYIPGFVEIGPPVPEKTIFEGFLPYIGMAAIVLYCIRIDSAFIGTPGVLQ